MRGGFFHNHILLDPFEEHFLRVGTVPVREFRVVVGQRIGFIDLFAVVGHARVACEAELRTDRVIRDLEKATAAEATHLFIIVPDRRVAARSRGLISACGIPTNFATFVLPLGTALTRFRDCFPLLNSPFADQEINKQPRRGGP